MTSDPAPIDSLGAGLPLGCPASSPRRAVARAPAPHPPWDGGAAADGPSLPVEERLAQLAAAVGPLRRVLAAIAARLVATRAWERLCYARLADYARERPGVSARQIQELARVDNALAGLPALEQALVANVLSWSKVRLLAGVATAEDEHGWIARAQALPTRRLEREVRERARPAGLGDPDEAAPARRVALRCTPAVREKWSLVSEVAERVAGQHLRAGEVLEWVAAEAFSALSIDPGLAEPEAEPPPRRHGDSETSPRAASRLPARAPAGRLPHAIPSLAAGLEDADPFDLDRRLRRAVRLEQTLDAAIAPLLRIVRCAEYEWSGDYQPLGDYACDQLGMSARKARALLRLERAGDVCPELRAAYRRGRISWVKAQCLLPLLLLELDGEWRPAWVDWATRVTLRRLAQDVERALLLRAGHPLAWQRCKFQPERAQDPIPSGERQMCAPDVDPEATQQLAWRLPRDVALLLTAVRETLRARLTAPGRRVPTDGEVFDELLDGALAAWTLRDPGARRPDPVIERDGYRCAIPGCTSRRNLQDHHVVFRSAQGSDDPGNRITLCAFHHLRCLHARLLRVRGRAPADLVFELGVRPGVPPLARYRSGDVALA